MTHVKSNLPTLHGNMFVANFEMYFVDGFDIVTQQKIKHSKKCNDDDTDENDWLNEAKPAVRMDQPFRSCHWQFLYFSLPLLINASGANIHRTDGQGHTLNINLRLTNKRRFIPF